MQGLDQIIGERIEKIEAIHDYLQIWFSNGALLNVYNAFDLLGTGGLVSSLVQGVIQQIKTDDCSLMLSLVDGRALRIGLLDADFRGPEAMEYIGVDGVRVVWP